MKRYKQADKCYQDALDELNKLIKQTNKQSEFYKKMSEKISFFVIKLKQKIAMSCYY